jgi:hypothetical protein
VASLLGCDADAGRRPRRLCVPWQPDSFWRGNNLFGSPAETEAFVGTRHKADWPARGHSAVATKFIGRLSDLYGAALAGAPLIC